MSMYTIPCTAKPGIVGTPIWLIRGTLSGTPMYSCVNRNIKGEAIKIKMRADVNEIVHLSFEVGVVIIYIFKNIFLFIYLIKTTIDFSDNLFNTM